MLAKPTLHPTAKSALRDLRNDHHVEPDIEEILWLNDLAKHADNVEGDRMRLMGRPVKAGNEWLWPFTIASSLWWQEWNPKFELPQDALGCLAIALAHSRILPKYIPQPITKLWDLKTFDEVKSAIDTFLRDLYCTPAELEAAIDELLPSQIAAPDEKQGKAFDLPALCLDLCAMTGIPVDYWTQQLPLATVVEAYQRTIDIERAKQGGKSKAGIMAVRDLALACGMIVEAHKAKETD